MQNKMQRVIKEHCYIKVQLEHVKYVVLLKH